MARFENMTAEQHLAKAAQLRRRARWGIGPGRRTLQAEAQLHLTAATAKKLSPA